MAFQQSVALASLTATYTDSEGEDDGPNQGNNVASDSDSRHSLLKSPPPPKPVITFPVKVNPVARLVSYNDDLVLSDDDETGEHRHAILRTEIIPEEPVVIPPEDNDIELPPEPTGRCSIELQEKIARLHDKMVSSGLDMNYVIQQRKDFRNPSIYEKLIQFCSINEFGTNYPPEIYDPLNWGKESFYEELEKVQRAEMARRDKERKEKTKVEFVVGTAKKIGTGSNPGSGTEDESKRRKSKWDQVNVNMMPTQPLRPATLLPQSALTTAATGTKGTVISAFGSLPKKPRV